MSMSGQEAEAALAAAQEARACELAEMQARLEQAAQAAAEDLDAAALDRSRLLGRRAGQISLFWLEVAELRNRACSFVRERHWDESLPLPCFAWLECRNDDVRVVRVM